NRIVSALVPAPPSAVPSEPHQIKSPPPKASPGWPVVLAASSAVIGAAALGGATYFYIRGIHDGGALRERCGSPPSCSREDVDAAHAKLVVGDVLAGVGLLAAGAAVYIFLTRGHGTAQAYVEGLRIHF